LREGSSEMKAGGAAAFFPFAPTYNRAVIASSHPKIGHNVEMTGIRFATLVV